MTTARHTKGLALAGLTALLGSTALAVVAPTAQAAVTGTTSYTCATPFGPVAVPVTVASEALPASVPAGASFPQGLLPVSVSFTVPAAFAGGLPAIGVTSIGGGSDDFAIGLGQSTVPLQGINAEPVPIEAGKDVVIQTLGSNGAFTTPAPGVQALTLPSTFKMTPTDQTGAPLPVTLDCAITDPAAAQFGSVTTTKQGSVTTAKAAKKIKQTQSAIVAVVVKRQSGDISTGKVTAKDGKKSVGAGTLKNGKLALKLKKLAPGKHSIMIKYAGDKFAKASQTKVVIMVTKVRKK